MRFFRLTKKRIKIQKLMILLSIIGNRCAITIKLSNDTEVLKIFVINKLYNQCTTIDSCKPTLSLIKYKVILVGNFLTKFLFICNSKEKIMTVIDTNNLVMSNKFPSNILGFFFCN